LKYFTLFALLLIVVLLPACKVPAAATPEPTQPAPEAVFTSAAQTADAMRQQRFAQTTTPKVEQLIATVAAPTPTSTLPPVVESPLPTLPAPTAVLTTTAPAPPEPGDDKGEFVADISIPDGTSIGPEKKFVKTWQLRNVGKTTWTTDYALIFIDGDLMGATPSVALEKEVAPYDKIDISVEMVAPSTPGKYRGYWMMRNADGKIFGMGVNADEAIWVEINVDSSAAFIEGTPENVTDNLVDNVSLAIDNPAVNGDCPHTFVFTAIFTLRYPTQVTYSLEAGDNAGNMLKVPPPTTRNMDSGTHSLVYELSFPSSTSGWARLHITEPEQVFSNQVDFSLTC
jgi:hypothetical protein